VSDLDLRSTRLQWIRDGSNWLVGIGTGALVLSGTYFYDRFARSPNAASLLIAAWILLTLSALFGVLTSFSAWKDLKPKSKEELPLGGWVKNCYTLMMWTFVLGFVCLAIVLILNVISSSQTGRSKADAESVGRNVTAELFLAGDPLPPFAPASAIDLSDEFIQGVCRNRQTLQDAQSPAALVVGRYDRRSLSPRAVARFGSNVGLAQQRAERVRILLSDAALCKSREISHILTLVAGPRLTGSPLHNESHVLDAALAEDRRVEVYGIRIRE
jgi:uncharacterized membrane protein